MSNTSINVAEMESELYALRSDNQQMKTAIAVITADRDRLAIENTLHQNRTRDVSARCTRMETIMKQVSSGLIAGLNEMAAEQRMAQQIASRADVNPDDEEPPRPKTGPGLRLPSRANETVQYLDTSEEPNRPSLQTHAVSPLTGLTEMERRELRAGMRPGRINLGLAAQDPRLPPIQMTDADTEQLLDLGGAMQTTR